MNARGTVSWNPAQPVATRRNVTARNPMRTPVPGDAMSRNAAARTAGELVRELERYGIAAQVHAGYGLAVLLAGSGVVWCGRSHIWWTVDEPASCSGLSWQRRYVSCPASAVEMAAQLIATRHRDLPSSMGARRSSSGSSRPSAVAVPAAAGAVSPGGAVPAVLVGRGHFEVAGTGTR